MTPIFPDLHFITHDKAILQRYNINKTFIEQPITEFCIQNGINVHFMETIVLAFNDEALCPILELNRFEINVIIEYLEKTHEYYLNTLLPEMEQTLMHLIKSIGFSDFLPIQLFEKFVCYRKELQEHILEEEKHFFPYIKGLLNGGRLNDAYTVSVFQALHHHKEEALVELRELVYANNTFGINNMPYRVFLSKMELLERDLRVHAKVEDEVLVPKVELLENI
jgi:regulator of cell morphogenesis and NO signaling